MAKDLGVELATLIGNAALVEKIPLSKYVSEAVGEPTLRDIIAELKKPGRDPRATFEKPAFRDDVTEFDHVREGMVLEGVVTNVTAFGAFVDIGVHQDGLVHVSELSDRFIREPSEVVKTGDKLKVRVLSIDKARKRIALSAKSQSSAGPRPAAAGAPRPDSNARPQGNGQQRPRDSRPPRGGFDVNPFAGL
jgi:uncharacterized protein